MEENFTIIKADHKEIILDIIQSIIKVIINPLKMLLSSNPELKIDVGKFLSEVNKQRKSSFRKTKCRYMKKCSFRFLEKR